MSRYVAAEELSRIDPAALASALLDSGWRELPGKPGFFRALESPDGSFDVTIPAHPDWADYLQRLNEALSAAEAALGDDAESFIRDLRRFPV